MSRSDESEVLDLLREHRELFERLAESGLPISEDAQRGLARLDEERDADE
jgi:hypothetical protein